MLDHLREPLVLNPSQMRLLHPKRKGDGREPKVLNPPVTAVNTRSTGDKQHGYATLMRVKQLPCIQEVDSEDPTCIVPYVLKDIRIL